MGDLNDSILSFYSLSLPCCSIWLRLRLPFLVRHFGTASTRLSIALKKTSPKSSCGEHWAKNHSGTVPRLYTPKNIIVDVDRLDPRREPCGFSGRNSITSDEKYNFDLEQKLVV